METVYFFTVILLMGLAFFIYKKTQAPKTKGGSMSGPSQPKRRHTDK